MLNLKTGCSSSFYVKKSVPDLLNQFARALPICTSAWRFFELSADVFAFSYYEFWDWGPTRNHCLEKFNTKPILPWNQSVTRNIFCLPSILFPFSFLIHYRSSSQILNRFRCYSEYSILPSCTGWEGLNLLQGDIFLKGFELILKNHTTMQSV